MSAQMMLEADHRLTLEMAFAAVESCGYTLATHTKDGFVAVSKEVAMPIHYRSRGRDVDLFTDDGKYKPNWLASSVLVMKVVTTQLDACKRVLSKLVAVLSESSEAYFVLSYQYERILTLKDDSGLRNFQSEWARHFDNME